MTSDKQRVRFQGGPMSGAEIEMPANVDPAELDLVVTSGGIVWDRRGRRPLRGARIIRRPSDEP
jgi:hypothetical protein